MRAEESTRDAVKSTRQCRIWLPSRSCRFLSERLRRTAGIYSYKKDWGGGTTANLWYLHDSAHNYDYNKAYFAGYGLNFCEKLIRNSDGSDYGIAVCGQYSAARNYAGDTGTKPLAMQRWSTPNYLWDYMEW